MPEPNDKKKSGALGRLRRGQQKPRPLEEAGEYVTLRGLETFSPFYNREGTPRAEIAVPAPAAGPSADRSRQDAVLPAGWLVCVRGPHYGQDFRLYEGRNHMGREDAMEIPLTKDISVSRVQHATLLFSRQENVFALAETRLSQNPVYLNGRVLRGQRRMAAYDVIALGATELMLVPFYTPENPCTGKKDQT